MKYTEEEINKILNLRGANGELIDIFRLHGVIFFGNSKKGVWDLGEAYVRFSNLDKEKVQALAEGELEFLILLRKKSKV